MAKTTTTKKKAVQKTAKPAAASKAKVLAAKKKTVKAKKAAAPAPAKKALKPVKKKAEPVKKNNVKKNDVKKVDVKKIEVKKAVVKKTPAAKVVIKKTDVKKVDVKTKKITKDKKEKVMPRKKTRDVDAKIKQETENAVTQPTKPLVEGPMLQGKSVAHIKGYSKEELEQFKKIILDKRDEILEQLQNLQEQMYDPSTGEYINENSPYSLHMAEQGTDAMEREKTFLYAQRENKFLGYLEESLKRIESGTYGICIDCIDNPQHLCPTCPLVPKARLEAVPHSQLCVEIKRKQEKFK
ncbi:MAG: conjugal transfer protein TraR [Bacteroidota bacterium]|nr:conjugal transfer protein TraR [Bacteroidota bacterium]